MLPGANRSRGAGSDDTVEPEYLMKDSLRVLRGPDDPTGKKGKMHNERSVKLVVDLGDLDFHAKSDVPSMWEELAGDFPQIHRSTLMRLGRERGALWMMLLCMVLMRISKGQWALS